MAHVELIKVNKTFNGAAVLSSINCTFFDKKITAIVGKSGSGKSTLLKLVNGLEKPSTGTVKVFNTPINEKNDELLRKRIGYSVQGTGLFPHLTTQKNITLLADLANWSAEKIHRRLHQLIELVQLDQQLLERYPHELSGGQQQRAGLCRAMMLDPEILLFDEAFAAVDPLTRSEIHQQILNLQQIQPKTIIFVTHDLQEAFTLADYIMIIHRHEIVVYKEKSHFINTEGKPDYTEILRWLT